ncbi:MAG: cell division protein FtsA, partial [Lachnospira sp.]|nr:cell division protein FtsA [Lachnospira sp.]
EKLVPRRGAGITFSVNGKTRMVLGAAGEGAVVTLNGKTANLNTPIEQNDVIDIKESTAGEAASLIIGQLEEFESIINFIVNEKTISCPRFAYVNGELKSEFYDINDGDKIRMENFYTVAQLMEFMDLDMKEYEIFVNNEPADKNTKVYENFSVKLVKIDEQKNNDYEDEVVETDDGKVQKDIETEISDVNQSTLVEKPDKLSQKAEVNMTEITITVNGVPVHLTGKKDYILVDLFQFYDFDLSKPQGNVVLKHNGVEGVYTAPLQNGDVVQLYWEKSNQKF